jgi:hypothetical protein
MYSRIIILSLTIVVCAGNLFAQKSIAKKTDSDYRKYPYWIDMMNDTTSNYFEAEKAFNLFWENKIKPVEEKDILNEHSKKERKSFLDRLFKSRKERQREESERYAFQYKKFLHWQMTVSPYVQADGRILTPSERLNEWEQHKSIK